MEKSKSQNTNTVWKVIVVVLVILLGVSFFINIEKSQQISSLTSQEKPASCDISEYEEKISALELENQEILNTNTDLSTKNTSLESELKSTRDTLSSTETTLQTTTDSLTTTKAGLTQAKNLLLLKDNIIQELQTSHIVIYVDENYTTIYSERVSPGADVANVPTVPEKDDFHAEWSSSGENIQGDTVIYPRYYHLLSFTVEDDEGAEINFSATEPIKVYGDQLLTLTTSQIQIDDQTILEATFADDTSADYEFAGWYFGDNVNVRYGDDLEYFGNEYTMNEDLTAKIFINYTGCILAGSKITMADGTEKNVEDIKAGDMVMSYDYRAGDIRGKEVLALLANTANVDVLTVKLSNGSELKIADIEYLFDTDAKKFIEVSPDTSDDLIGKNVMVNNSGSIATAQITSIETHQEKVDHYTMYIADTNNYIANGIIAHIPAGVLNTYQIDDDFKMDYAQYLADVAQYGLYTYDQFSDVISEDLFNALHVADSKIVVEKGLATFDYIYSGAALIQQEITRANELTQ